MLEKKQKLNSFSARGLLML